jgi:hypothetical protein
MENMDILDKRIPKGGDIIEITPPYIAHGHCGQPMNLSYTEKVSVSSSFAPTV